VTFDAAITFLYVSDLERSHAFYAGLLALPLALDQGSCRIYRVATGGYLGTCERPAGASPEGIIVTLVSPDVDDWHQRLTAAGVPCERPPTLNEGYRVYHSFFRDPDGYLVEIQEFRDERW
jgi:catechol 2,3-dioxygenase-like lactoylglutathione lyase family enzyme